MSAIDVTTKVFFERSYWFLDWAHWSSESTVRIFPHPHCSPNNYFSISVQFFSDVAPHFLSAHYSPSNLDKSRYPWLNPRDLNPDFNLVKPTRLPSYWSWLKCSTGCISTWLKPRDCQFTKVDLNVVQVAPTRSQPGWDLNLVEISIWLNPRDCQVTKVELNVVQVEPTRSQPGWTHDIARLLKLT